MSKLSPDKVCELFWHIYLRCNFRAPINLYLCYFLLSAFLPPHQFFWHFRNQLSQLNGAKVSNVKPVKYTLNKYQIKLQTFFEVILIKGRAKRCLLFIETLCKSFTVACFSQFVVLQLLILLMTFLFKVMEKIAWDLEDVSFWHVLAVDRLLFPFFKYSSVWLAFLTSWLLKSLIKNRLHSSRMVRGA